MLSLLNIFSRLYRTIPRLGRLTIFGFLGAGLSYMLWASQVHASSTVLLQFRDLKQTTSLTDLKAFANGQDPSPALEKFLSDTNQSPTEVKQWLTTEITPHALAPLVSTEFVLLQVNKTLGDPLGREDLDPLKTALDKSFGDDNSFSILEILEDYPGAAVRLEVSRLKQAFTDINQWVSRIGPILGVAEKLLPELLCECESPTVSGESTKSAIAYGQTQDSLKALQSEQETTLTVDPDLLALAPSDSPALANKKLVIQFGLLAPSISMQDLTYFAETGELSSAWRFMLGLAKINPDDLRSALKQDVSVDLLSLDRLLNNLLGEFLLFQVGQIVQTPSNTANIQALRAASVLSVADDNKLSVLEILQQYPTQNVVLNGLQLARLGRITKRFQAQGGLRGTALNIEDWLVHLQSSAAEGLCQCDGSDTPTQPTKYSSIMVTPTIAPEKIAQFLPVGWEPVAPHREDHGIIKVVWLKGSPYDMGYQHGQYLHDEIASLGTKVLGALRFAGKGLALGRLAAHRSFPNIVDECRGLTDATQDIGMTLDACLVLSYADVFQEVFGATLPEVLFWEGCSQWVAAGDATIDGRLYHGSTVDNDKKPVDYIVKNPVVFIRQPVDGLPHIFISYPGVLWPNWGLNAAGITVGLDTLHPSGPNELSFEGGSNVQIMAKVLKTATTFAEAREIMETQPRVRANLIMIADGKSKEAGVFEFTGRHLDVREMPDNGVIYMTNHSLLDEMAHRQRQPLSESSLLRFERFSQLMQPDGISSLYGTIDPTAMAKIGRDRINPKTLQASPHDLFDDNASPGGNGSLRQAIYDPDRLLFWVAAGSPPVPENPFVCFSLGEMLNFPNAAPCESPSL